MQTRSNIKLNNNLEKNNNSIKLGGFPSILFLGQKNKKLKEYSKINNNEDLKNISKFNILNIKNILGV
jgi:hypothetical protein